MTETYPLYDGEHPSERASQTSRAAAAAMPKKKSEAMRMQIYKRTVETDDDGMTCDEVEVVFDLRHQTASARLRELVLLDAIKDSGRTRPTRSGRKATVWVKK